MDKTAVGLLGAVAGVAAISPAQAAADPALKLSEALQVSSYADLLKPIPDALALIRANDAARAQLTSVSEGVQTAQGYYYGYGNPYNAPYPPYATPYGYYPPYYHHHHHGYYRPYYHHHHHHHHHHHNGFFGGR